MIAKIVMPQKKEFYSFIFAIYGTTWESKVIVFDTENDCFFCVNFYRQKPAIKRQVFIIEHDEETYIEKELEGIGHVEGVDWLMNNPSALRCICNSEEVKEEILQRARECNKKFQNKDYDGWKYVKDAKDIKDLLTAALGFHDAYISEISYHSGGYTTTSAIKIVFSGCWEAKFTLEFIGFADMHFARREEECGEEIFEANIFMEDGYIIWVDDNVNAEAGIEEFNNYFKARALKWKMETEMI